MDISFRPLAKTDLPKRMEWLNDPEINRYLGQRVRAGTDMAFHEAWFEKYDGDEKRQILMIEVDGVSVGHVGLTDINLGDQNAAIYIIIGEKEFWGRGVGWAAMQFILGLGFEKLKLHKLWLDVHAQNTGAIKLYEKCGFTTEGVFVHQVQYKDGFGDEIRMGLIRSK